MTKKANGRPPAITQDVLDKLEEAFAWGCSDREACLWADIAPATLYKYQEKHPDFTERKAALKDKPVLLARKSVIKSMQKDGRLAMDYLSRKRKDEFSTKSESDVKLELPTPILGGIVKQNEVQRDDSAS